MTSLAPSLTSALLESRLRRRCALSARSRASPLWTMSTWSAGANSSTRRTNLAIAPCTCAFQIFTEPTCACCSTPSTHSGSPAARRTATLAPHTEAGLQQFQENVGLFADGMAFQDTFNYINRLHHIWKGKPSVSESDVHIGFARAASVLERNRIAVIGVDPIARNVASRMWNIATATTNSSGMQLCDREAPDDVDIVFEIASDPLPDDCALVPRSCSPSARMWGSASAQRSPQRQHARPFCASSSPGSRDTARSRQAMPRPLRSNYSTAFAMR